MKTIRWVLVAVLALGAMGWVLARAESGKPGGADSAVRALQKQVENLQARLRALEDRLGRVESGKPSTAPRIQILPKSPGSPGHTLPLVPVFPGGPGHQPKVSGQREINGWDFYFIPCAGK